MVMKKPGPWVALIIVWVFWGSTYIAIRVGVESIPPLLMAGIRYLVAGLLLLPFALRAGSPEQRRTDRPRAVQWLGAAVVGGLLLGCGNGGVTAAERTVPAGLASLLVASVPLWLTVLDFVMNKARIRLPALGGLLCGLAGVVFLARPTGGSGRGTAIILGASLAWALGTLLSRKLPAPDRPLVASAMQMLTGGVLLLAAAAASGELSGFSLSQVSARSAWSVVWLVGPGSILALSAYVIAVRELPTSIVGTYAYVNPVIAVALAATLLSERITTSMLIGGVLIIAGVALVVRYRSSAPSPARDTGGPASGGGPDGGGQAGE
jgi:drug/metabolite transporter (DMT)-like permease